MSFMNHFTTLFTYFTPARSPMFAVAVAGTVAIGLASTREVPVSQIMTNSVAEFLQGFKGAESIPADVRGAIEWLGLEGLRYKFYPYMVADGSTVVWAMIILPIFLVILATIPVSLKINPDPTDPPPTNGLSAGEKESLWRSHYNLSRAFCLSTPLLFLVLTIIYLPRADTDSYTFSIYYLLNYLVCVFQIAVFFGFLFAEYKANSPHYNLIQFSLITTCLLIGASFENSEAAEISVLAARDAAKVQSAKLALSEKDEALLAAQTTLSKVQAAVPPAEATTVPKTQTATPPAAAATVSKAQTAAPPKPDPLSDAKQGVVEADKARQGARDDLESAITTAARYDRPNRPAVTMTLLYMLWGLCMVFWVRYLKRMTKIKFIFSVSPESVVPSQVDDPTRLASTIVAESAHHANGN
jgi:hypothetical protein